MRHNGWNERGATAVEYGLLVAAVLLAFMGGIALLGEALGLAHDAAMRSVQP